jgi:hypothetical protein
MSDIRKIDSVTQPNLLIVRLEYAVQGTGALGIEGH